MGIRYKLNTFTTLYCTSTEPLYLCHTRIFWQWGEYRKAYVLLKSYKGKILLKNMI